MDQFPTIEEPGYAQTRVLGSRFFGTAVRAADAETALELLEGEKKLRHDATHWCFAYRLFADGEVSERSSDAGEPKGTAGQPILREIQSLKLVNGLVIVTRYFGGTKLGTGRLARAYGDCAKQALQAAGVRVCRLLTVLKVKSSFDDQGIVYHVAAKHQAIIEQVAAADGAEFEVKLPRKLVEVFRRELREASGGRLSVRREGEWIC